MLYQLSYAREAPILATPANWAPRVEALWRIAATDGINADEQGFMRLTASLLGVSDQDSGLARQRVLRDGR